MPRIIIEKDSHVAIVRFNRPEKMNALDKEQFNEIINVGEQLNADPSIRAIVLTGEGKAFCAGLDIGAQFSGSDDMEINQLTSRTYGISNLWQKVVWQWREMPVPVIAAVHGYALGGGLQIMMAADIRIVEPNTKMAIMETKWGLIPDMAGTQLFRHSVRDDVIKLLTYTHRIFSGTEALQYGFATQLSENPVEDAITIAKEIAAVSPSAIVHAKKLLNSAPYLNEADGLLTESVAQQKLIKSKNQLEAIMAGLQKRDGNFEDYRE